MDCTIRSARPDDAPALAALSAQLGYPLPPDELLANLRRLQGEPAHGLLVAEVAGAVVGWAHVREEWSLEAGGRAELAGLVVDAERRGHGIGAQLVREAEAWARARGLPRIRVRTRIQREAARRFYGRLGYAESKIQAVLDKGLASLP